jgi:hypothetical protein
VPPEVAAELVKISPAQVCVYTGEMVPGSKPKYHIWQVLSWNGQDLRQAPYNQRRRTVPDLSKCQYLANVYVAEGPLAKRKLYQEIVERKGEGLVLKLDWTVHHPGEDDSWLKWKITAEADVELGELKAGKSSRAMYLRDETGKRVLVGYLTIPPNKTHFKTGDVATVRYLYATAAFQIYQGVLDPANVGPRTDKKPESCLLSQLKLQPEEADDV